ncbi:MULTISPECIES: hypothetical protein, partial [Mycobacterium avium complex (MAC)]
LRTICSGLCRFLVAMILSSLPAQKVGRKTLIRHGSTDRGQAISSTQCFEAHCDECGEGLGGRHAEEDQTVHYSHRTALKQALPQCEWAATGERLLCPCCQRDAACALIGHQWDEWDSIDLPQYRGRRRQCDHCDAAEFESTSTN